MTPGTHLDLTSLRQAYVTGALTPAQPRRPLRRAT